MFKILVMLLTILLIFGLGSETIASGRQGGHRGHFGGHHNYHYNYYNGYYTNPFPIFMTGVLVGGCTAFLLNTKQSEGISIDTRTRDEL
jgi:hypothetical protein